jgi:hypothetical protein
MPTAEDCGPWSWNAGSCLPSQRIATGRPHGSQERGQEKGGRRGWARRLGPIDPRRSGDAKGDVPVYRWATQRHVGARLENGEAE